MKASRTLLLSLVAMSALTVAQDNSGVIDKNATSTSGSMWVDGRNPLIDRTARREGDLLTILISESSVASFSATTTASKTSDASAVQNVLKGLFSFLDLNGTRTSSGSTKDNGTGSTQQNGSLRARLTAEVLAVTPAGHLIIEGTRKIVINKETQLFKLTGIVRRDDITPDNTVLSEAIAQAEIRMEGKGQIADKQRRGILTQLLDWLF